MRSDIARIETENPNRSRDAKIGWILLSALAILILCYIAPQIPQSGFGPSEQITETYSDNNGVVTHTVSRTTQPAKTWWDLLQLLIVPAVLAVGAYFLNTRARDREFKIAEQRRQYEEQIAEERLKETTLQTYLDQVTELVLNGDLSEADKSSPVKLIAYARTVTALARLDGRRNGIILNFLMKSGLLGSEQTAGMLADVDLSGADFRNANFTGISLQGKNLARANLADTTWGVASSLSNSSLKEAKLSRASLGGVHFISTDLSGADMTLARLGLAKFDDANLSGTDLSYADLRRARLSRARLVGARLQGANLRSATLAQADLTDADLTGAELAYCNLSGATLTAAQLSKVRSLHHATMPDGTIYDGKFNLYDDIASAREDGVNMNNPEEIRRWYSGEYWGDKN